jgi:TonB-linked SusC/RagA family outer membrane protein
MKKIINLLLGFLLIGWMANPAAAQSRTITGKVTSASDKEPLVGVTVVVQGTSNGVLTDNYGNYTISLPPERSVLVFSYLGMKKVEVAVGTNTSIDVAMQGDGKGLDEVIITGNAIKRERRSLGYSTATVRSEELTQGRDRSVFNSLAGKVAGLTITNGSGNPGSSTRILLRGGSSILGNNQPLIVVDGIPIDNRSIQNADQLSNQVDNGNRGNDINPEDVESVTVLKGPAASALYGSRASNGAIIITTKSGKSRSGKNTKSSVSYVTSYTNENILKLPEFQSDYGQGGKGEPDSRENFSWGPKFDGKMRPWGQAINGQQKVKPYSNLPDNVKDFFNTGHTFTNSVALGGGSDRSTYYLSISDLKNTGVVPGTDYRRNTFKVSGSTVLANKITSSASVSYVKTNSNISAQGQQNTSVYNNVLQTARDIPISELKDLDDPFNTLEGYYGAYTLNPYYVLANSNNRNEVDNILANMQLGYKPLSWLDFTYRLGTNFYTDSRYQESPKFEILHGQNTGMGPEVGKYSEFVAKVADVTSDLMVTANKDLTKHLNMTTLLGHNLFQSTLHSTSAATSGLVVPEFYHLSNSKDKPVVDNTIFMKRLVGVYGDIGFNYKDFLFLNVTGRNDWTSTLAKGNRSYFYPSVSSSFVFTDVLKLNPSTFSYGKLRIGLAKTGRDANPYSLASVFNLAEAEDGYRDSKVTFPINGIPGFERGDRIGNPNLTPEFNYSREIGLEMSFLKNRVGLDLTLYSNYTKDLIMPVSIASSSGYTQQTINAGKISNKGIELLVRGTPIKTKGFEWNTSINFAKNNSMVDELIDGVDQLSIGNALNDAQMVAAKGHAYGQFYVVGEKRDSLGRIIIDAATGLPQVADEPKLMGTYLPKWTGSWVNSFSYKGITLTLQFDHREGGLIYSRTKDIMEFVGTSSNTVINGGRDSILIANSSYDRGDGVYLANSRYKVDVQDYFTDQTNNAFNLLDGSFTKLREISVSYVIPAKYLSKTPFGNLVIGFSGRNLWLKTPAENIFIDPETSSFGTGNNQGYEFGTIPSLKSYGFNLRATF